MNAGECCMIGERRSPVLGRSANGCLSGIMDRTDHGLTDHKRENGNG